MNYLLDTHTFIWSLLESNKLSISAKKIITNKRNVIYISAVSFWEISLKVRIKKYSFKGVDIKMFPELAEKMGFHLLTLEPYDAVSYHELKLKNNHKDPFDRMLIWKAIRRGLVLISKDSLFEQYKREGLKLIW